MTSLLHKLGLSKTLTFSDVYSIDEPDLLAIVPRPSYALLLVFPVNDTYEKFRSQEDNDVAPYEGHGPNEEVMWFKQTIRNACGLIGILHGASNGETRDHIGETTQQDPRPLAFSVADENLFVETNSDLDKLLKQAVELKPVDRAELLYNSTALETAHKSAAVKGDSTVPEAEDNVELHYVCFVKSKDNNLWEMDGRRKGPILRGKLETDDDVLSQKALDMGPRAFLRREQEAGGGDLRFSLISLGRDFD